MAEDLNQKYKFDASELINGLQAGIDKLDQFGKAVTESQAAAKQSYSEIAAASTRYSDVLAKQVSEVRQAQAVQRELSGVLQQLTQQQRELNQERGKSKGSEEQARITRELKSNAEEQRKVRTEIKLNQEAIQAERRAVEQVRDARRQETNATKQVAAAGKDAEAAARQEAKQKKESAAAADKAARAADKAARAAGLLTQLEQKLTDLTERRARATTRIEVRGYNQQIKDTQKQIANLKDGADDTGGSVSKMFGRFAGAAGAAAAISLVVGFVKNLAEQAIEAGKKADATLGKLQFARGNDLSKATGDLAALTYEANRLGLDLNAAGASYGSFTAAAAAGNLPLAEARRLYLAVGGASAVLRVSSADTEGALRALQQMVSKGTVSAEELRGQLGERLPGAFSIAAKAIGVTEKELGKMLERGEIAASDFLPKFARELEKTFGDGTAAAADSLQANTNRIDNEWQRFLLRFVSNTGKAVSAIASLAKQTNDFLDGFTLEGQLSLAEQQAVTGVKRYQSRLEKLLDQTATQVKARGGNVAEAVGATLDLNQARLQKNLDEAEALAKKYANPNYINEFNAAGGGGFNELRPLIEGNQKRVALLKGEIQVIEDVRIARQKAAEDEGKNIQGLIEKQQLLIKSLQDRQKNATQENEGNGADFLFGKGGLNQQLVAAQKELDRLLGKVDKVRKQADKLTPALRALEAERRRLAKEYDKAELEDLRDQGQARAKEQLRQDFNSIKQLETTLKEKEAAVRKAGGRGADADGVIDGKQAEQLAILRQLATERYYEALRKIAQDHADKLFALQADSDAKEREAVERKYEQQAQDARGQADLLVAIEEAKQRELLALEYKQTTDRINQQQAEEEAFIRQRIGLGGTGTGLSEIEADRAVKRELLRNELKFLREKLNATLLTNDKIGAAERARLKLQEQEINKQLKKLDQQENRDKFNLYSLFLGEEDSEENRQKLDQVVGQFASQLDGLLQAEIDNANARIQVRTQNINELQSELQTQIALAKTGAASNIQTVRDQLQQEKDARRQAIEDQKKAARAKLLLDTATQIGSLASASATIFEVTAPLNVIPGLGTGVAIGLIATMLGAFIGAKVKALSAINSSGTASSGFFTGGYTGDGNPRDEAGVVHKREFVNTAETTAVYRPLFEALHQGKPIDWGLPQLQALLPDYSLPGKMQQDQQRFVVLQQQQNIEPLRQEIGTLRGELQAIKTHVAATAGRPDVVGIRQGQLILRWPNGNEQLVNYPASFKQ